MYLRARGSHGSAQQAGETRAHGHRLPHRAARQAGHSQSGANISNGCSRLVYTRLPVSGSEFSYVLGEESGDPAYQNISGCH